MLFKLGGITAFIALLIVWTWNGHVDSLFLGLTGRKLVIQGTVFIGMTGFFVACGVGAWTYHHPETNKTVLAVLPWLLGMLIVCRLLAARWALRHALCKDLLDVRTVRWGVTAWLTVGFVLFGILAWSVPEGLVPTHYIAFIVLFALLMARGRRPPRWPGLESASLKCCGAEA